jgi:hypothetical protein
VQTRDPAPRSEAMQRGLASRSNQAFLSWSTRYATRLESGPVVSRDGRSACGRSRHRGDHSGKLADAVAPDQREDRGNGPAVPVRRVRRNAHPVSSTGRGEGGAAECACCSRQSPSNFEHRSNGLTGRHHNGRILSGDIEHQDRNEGRYEQPSRSGLNYSVLGQHLVSNERCRKGCSRES